MRLGERAALGHPLGVHRVLDSDPRLPQAAEKLDNSLPIFSNEILIRVEKLNIDAASFVQMEEETNQNESRIREIILKNCETRGKQQNRVTGSGGMLMGRVEQVGSRYHGTLKRGDRIATLVSLSLTPLHLEEVGPIHSRVHQVEAKGYAILFERTIAAVLPKELDESVALAVYDVAGAPATVNGLCKSGSTLIVIGAGGKAGLLSCVAGRQKVGKSGKVYAIEPFDKAAQELKALGVCDAICKVDATDPLAVQASVEKLTRGKMGDVVINVASKPNTELSSILCAKPKGKVVFFSMATSFTKVALGAEGVVSSAQLIFGNGYYPNHGEFAIQLLRNHSKLKKLFYQRYTK